MHFELETASIKKPILTQSGPKSRVCVNAADGLWTQPGESEEKLQRAKGELEGRGWAEGRSKGGIKDKAPCASSSKGLWSDR